MGLRCKKKKKPRVLCGRRRLFQARKGLWGREEARLLPHERVLPLRQGVWLWPSPFWAGVSRAWRWIEGREPSGHGGPQIGWRTYTGQVGPSSGQGVGQGVAAGSTRRGSCQKRNPLSLVLRCLPPACPPQRPEQLGPGRCQPAAEKRV